MINYNNGLIILFRVFIGAAICPYIPALLWYAPTYITNVNNEFFIPFFYIFVKISYTVALLIGMPITFYLALKNKCGYKALAKTGFILGAVATAFFAYLLGITDMLLTIPASLWHGLCAAIGAVSFGFISGLPKWYNKSGMQRSRA